MDITDLVRSKTLKAMPDQNIQILRKETFLKATQNSIGTKIFNSFLFDIKILGIRKIS